MRQLRHQLIEEIAHQPAFPAVRSNDLPDMGIGIVGGEVAVRRIYLPQISR